MELQEHPERFISDNLFSRLKKERNFVNNDFYFSWSVLEWKSQNEIIVAVHKNFTSEIVFNIESQTYMEIRFGH